MNRENVLHKMFLPCNMTAVQNLYWGGTLPARERFAIYFFQIFFQGLHVVKTGRCFVEGRNIYLNYNFVYFQCTQIERKYDFSAGKQVSKK